MNKKINVKKSCDCLKVNWFYHSLNFHESELEVAFNMLQDSFMSANTDLMILSLCNLKQQIQYIPGFYSR